MFSPFSLLLAAGTLAGLAWTAWRVAPASRSLDQVIQTLDDSLGVLVGALLGGRLVYVGLHWAYYRQHLVEILQVWLGGLSGVGALGGGLLALLLVALLSQEALGVLADRLLPLGLCLAAAGWLACWQAGCAYGLEAGTAWWGLPAVDEWGQYAPRFPVQAIGTAVCLVLLWALDRYRFLPRQQTGRARGPGPDSSQQSLPGRAALLGLLGVSLAWLGLSFLRADPAPLWLGLRLEAWAGLGFSSLSLILLFWMAKSKSLKRAL